MSNVDAIIATGRVPSGIPAGYLKESRDGSAIGTISFICILTAVVVFFRCASRFFIVKYFGADDALALAGLVLLIAFVALAITLINLGAGRHYDYIQYIMPLQTVRLTETLDFIAHIVYTTALVTCRFSGLLFYHRIVRQSRRFANTIKFAAAFLVLSYLPQLLLLILHCIPVTTLWPYPWQPGVDDYTCLQWGVVYVTNSGISLFCDILLFSIPLAIIRFVKISRKRKIGLAMIFCPGLLVVGISVTRLVLVVKGQWDADESWTYDPMLAIETSELGGTLIALSVPGLKPLFDKLLSGRGSSTSSPYAFHSEGVGSVPKDTHTPHGTGDFSWTVQGGYTSRYASKDNESADVILHEVHYTVGEHDVAEIPLNERTKPSRLV